MPSTTTLRVLAGATTVLALSLSACEIRLASPPPANPAPVPSAPATVAAPRPTTAPTTAAPRPTTAPTPTTRPTTAPTPKPSAPPSPTPTPTTAPPPVPVDHPSTPGVPPGTRLTQMKGDLTITKPGTVISNAEILGRVSIKAPNVTIRNSRIRAQAPTSSGIVNTKQPGVVIKDTEILSDVRTPESNGIMGWNFTLERVRIHSVVDQVHIHGAGHVTIRDSWLHDNTHYEQDPLWGGKPSHDDNIQVTSGTDILIEGTRLEDSHSAAIMLGQDQGAIRNVTVRENTIAGGACSVNVAPKDHGPLAGLSIARNEFVLGTQRLPRCAVIALPTYKTVLADNVWQQTGDEVTLTRG